MCATCCRSAEHRKRFHSLQRWRLASVFLIFNSSWRMVVEGCLFLSKHTRTLIASCCLVDALERTIVFDCWLLVGRARTLHSNFVFEFGGKPTATTNGISHTRIDRTDGCMPVGFGIGFETDRVCAQCLFFKMQLNFRGYKIKRRKTLARDRNVL